MAQHGRTDEEWKLAAGQGAGHHMLSGPHTACTKQQKNCSSSLLASPSLHDKQQHHCGLQPTQLTAAVAISFGLMNAQSLPHSVLVMCVVGAIPSNRGMETFGRTPGFVTQVAPTAFVSASKHACAGHGTHHITARHSTTHNSSTVC